MDMIILIEQVKMCPRVLTRTNECVCGHSIFTCVAFLYMFTVDALCTRHSVLVFFFIVTVETGLLFCHLEIHVLTKTSLLITIKHFFACGGSGMKPSLTLMDVCRSLSE